MKILVAIDGSDAAFNALRSACYLAAKMGAYITAFYVNKGEAYSSEETVWTSIKERLARELETFGQETIRKAYEIGRESGVALEGVISEGIPSEEILEYVHTRGIIKLIVMGHSSKGRGAQEFVESTTKSVVARARTPVFVTSSEINIRRVLLAVDDSVASKTATKFCGSLIQSLGAALSVISIIPDAGAELNQYTRIAEVPNIDRYIEASERELAALVERTLSSTSEMLASFGVSTDAIIKKGKISDEIIIEAKKYDLLVVGVNKGTSPNKLGSTIHKLLDSHALNVLFVQ
jgi:nucleotide-binding universal stress UspA family protein